MLWDRRGCSVVHGLGLPREQVRVQLKKRRYGLKTPAAEGKKGTKVDDAVVETKVTIPILVNHEPLRDGSELLLYKAKAAPRPRASTPITMQSLVKNIRMAKASAAAAASGKAASSAAF